jgi:hypothetical protein
MSYKAAINMHLFIYFIYLFIGYRAAEAVAAGGQNVVCGSLS